MNKKYELLQDLPYVKKGAIYEQDGIRYTCNSGEFISDLKADSLSFQSIENNPTWFREVAQEPKIEINSVNRCYTKHNTVYDNDTNMLGITFGFNKMLSEQEMATVKSAIEKTLNTSTPTSELVEDKKDVDWEIIEFDYEGKGVNIIELRNDGKYYYQSPKGSLSGTLQVHIKNPAWLIRRVKRLSDKQYFHVGDTISQGRITGFHIEENIMVVEFEGNSRQSDLNLVSKLTSTPIDKEVKKEPFVWTDKLVMKIVGEAHRDGWEKYTLGLYDRVQEFKELNTNKH